MRVIARLVSLVFIVIAAPAQAIDIKEVTSPGGITAWLVEEHSIPFTALEIRFKGGASLDRPGKRGAINLMTALLEEGAGDLDATGFAAAREALASSYSYDVYDDSLTISSQFLTENRDEAVDLLRLTLTEPRFDDAAIERVRAQVLSIISSDAEDPPKIAGATFDRLAFGDHPYGSDLNGTTQSVGALTREDIETAFRDAIARDRIFVGAVGDITPDDLGALLDDLLGALPETGAEMPPEAPVLLDAGMTVVDFDTPQSVVIFGHDGIARNDPDFFAAFVMNQIIGAGGFGSRLMDEVREKRGLAYGIGAYLAPKDLGALYIGQFSSSNEKVAEAIEVVRGEWEKLAAEGVTEEELADAQRYLTGAYPLRFDGNGRIANILVGMQMDDLPISYINTRNDKVNAVTIEDVRRVAARIVKPDALHFVLVGQPEGLISSN